MTRRASMGSARLKHILGIAIAVIVGLGVAWWYFHGGADKAKEAAKQAEEAAEKAKASAQQNVNDTNAGFDASRERHTPK